jgi:hypothetical protein
MTFLEDLKGFLTTAGEVNVYRDMMPDQPDDTIGLFVWAHTVGAVNDGSGTRRVQVQCRSVDPDAAYATAHRVAALLDSGPDETVIRLAEDRWCIARPTQYPRKLGDDGKRTTYYCEFALWGDNKP